MICQQQAAVISSISHLFSVTVGVVSSKQQLSAPSAICSQLQLVLSAASSSYQLHHPFVLSYS
jgi:hypothetical protein